MNTEVVTQVKIRLMSPLVPKFKDYKYSADMTDIDTSCVNAIKYIFKHTKLKSFKFGLYSYKDSEQSSMQSVIITVEDGRVVNAVENEDLCVGDLINE